MATDIGVGMSHWKFGIPNFEMSSLFTYFNNLNEINPKNTERVKNLK